MKPLPSPTIRKLIFLCAGLLAVLLGLYAFRESWYAPLLRQTLDRIVLSSLGQHIAVGRISGSYWSNLVLEDISSEFSPENTTTVDIKVQRLEAHFRLMSLLRGRKAFLENLQVVAEAPKIVIVSATKAPKDDHDVSRTFMLPPWLPVMQVHNGAISWQHGEITVECQAVELEVGRPVSQNQPYRLTLAMDMLHLLTPSGNWEGPVAAKAEASATAITVQDLRLGDDLVARAVNFQWPGQAGEGLKFTGDLDLFEGRAKGTLAGKGDLWEGSLEITAINMARVPGHIPPLLHKGTLQGKASFRGDLNQSQTWEGTTSLHLDNGPERLMLAASLAENALRVERFSAEVQANKLVLEKASLPIPTLRNRELREMLQQATGRFSLQMTDIPGLLGRIMTTPLPTPPAGGYPEHQLIAAGRFQGGQAMVEKLDLTTAHNAIFFKDTGLKLPADPAASLLLSTLQAKGRVQIDDLGELAVFIGGPAMTGHLLGTIDVAGPLNSPVGDLALDGTGVNLNGVALDTVTVKAHADLDSVKIVDCRLLRGDDRITLSGTYYYKLQEMQDLELDVRLADLAAYNALTPWLRNAKGSLRATVHGAGPLTTPQLKLDLAGQDLSVQGYAVGTIHLEATNQATDKIAFIATVDRPPVTLRSTGEVKLDLAKNHAAIALQTLSLSGQHEWLVLDHPADFTLSLADGAELAVDKLLLTGPVGSLLLDGTIGNQPNNVMSVTVKDLRGDEWLELVDDRLLLEGGKLRIEIRGPWQESAVSVAGSVARFGERQLDTTLAGEFELSLGAEGILVRRWLLSDGKGSSLNLAGTMPANLLRAGALPKNRWDLQASLQLTDLGLLGPFLPADLPLRGALQGEAHLEGTWQTPSGRFHLIGTDLQPHDFMAQAPPGLFFAEMKGTLAGDRLLLQALTLKGEKLKLDGQGEVLRLPSWPDIIAGRGDWSSGRLDLRGTFDASDLGWLAKEAGLRTVRGRLQGDVTMTGPILQPALGGQLQLTSGEVRFDAAMTPFKNLQASAELDGRVIRFQKISGALGGAPFQGSGLVDFEPQDGPHLVLDLKGQDLLFYRQEGLKIRADADLHAQGPLSRLEISGDMALSDGHWTKNFNFLSLLPGPATPGVAHELPLFSLRQYPWSTVRFKIKGKTRNPFQVRNNIVRGSLRPDLLLSGTGETPVLTGVVYLDPSRIDMPAGKIFLKSGVMNFAAKDPTRPKLEVVGQARMMGYDINLTVSGTVAEPVVTLSSTPPLPEDQLLLLLLAGQAPAAGTAGTGGRRQGVLTAAVYLGQGFLSGLLGDNNDEPNQSVLERFELAVGRDVSRKGDETLDAQFLLLDLREKGAGSMYLTGNRDKFDYFNLGLKIVFRFQ